MNERKIVAYTVINPTGQYEDICLRELHKMLKEGWQPLGGLCADNSSVGNNSLYQVMVKYD